MEEGESSFVCEKCLKTVNLMEIKQFKVSYSLSMVLTLDSYNQFKNKTISLELTSNATNVFNMIEVE